MRVMGRLMVLLTLAALLPACSGSVRPASEGGDPSAQEVKAEVDEAAEALLPDLVARVGGDLTGMQATFYERSGFGIWDYTASGNLQGPPGTMPEALDAVAATLAQHDFTVERDDDQKRVTGTAGNVSVIVQAALLSDEGTVSALQVRVSSLEPTSRGDDFAQDAEPEDYLAYLK